MKSSDKLVVGFQKRTDTYSGLLGFIIPANEEKTNSDFQRWIDKSIPLKYIQNTPVRGFVFNKNINRQFHYSSSQKMRVFHPEGFEFEISLSNLTFIMSNTDILSQEVKAPCIIGFSGKKTCLLPENTEEAQKILKINNGGLNYISQHIYTIKNKEYVYVDKYQEAHILYNIKDKKFFSIKSISLIPSDYVPKKFNDFDFTEIKEKYNILVELMKNIKYKNFQSKNICNFLLSQIKPIYDNTNLSKTYKYLKKILEDNLNILTFKFFSTYGFHSFKVKSIDKNDIRFTPPSSYYSVKDYFVIDEIKFISHFKNKDFEFFKIWFYNIFNVNSYVLTVTTFENYVLLLSNNNEIIKSNAVDYIYNKNYQEQTKLFIDKNLFES